MQASNNAANLPPLTPRFVYLPAGPVGTSNSARAALNTFSHRRGAESAGSPCLRVPSLRSPDKERSGCRLPLWASRLRAFALKVFSAMQFTPRRHYSVDSPTLSHRCNRRRMPCPRQCMPRRLGTTRATQRGESHEVARSYPGHAERARHGAHRGAGPLSPADVAWPSPWPWRSRSDTQLRGAFNPSITGFYAAESGLNAGMGEYRNIFLDYNVPHGSDFVRAR